MRDTVLITGATWVGQGTVDPVTLVVTYPAPDEVYEGPARVRASASTLVIDDGGDRQEADEIVVTIPAAGEANEAAILPGCRVIVVDSEDFQLAGQEFEVRSVEPGGNLISRRLQCRRLQSFPSVGGS
jgi:hypothetical protein